ncbi:MAG: T9SS C-terminal target domain-containing protein, partial [Calditrichaeota bacterium]
GIIYTGTKERNEMRPENYYLAQNYPNPFNPSTVIEYGIPQSGRVRLLLYDLQGRLIRVLVDAHQAGGRFNIVWDGTDDSGVPVAAGVYYCRIQVNGFIQVIKLVLIK